MPPPQLHYAPRPPLRRRTIFFRAFTAISLFSLACVAWLWFPPAYRLAKLTYWQNRCLKYVFPKTGPVYSNRGKQSIVPPEWVSFYNLLSTGFQSSGTIYLHERRVPGGLPRLVAVDLLKDPADTEISLKIRLIDLAAGLRQPQEIFKIPQPKVSLGKADVLIVQRPGDDPFDQSHFEIHYRSDGEACILDGWLLSNDEVEIRKRPAPR